MRTAIFAMLFVFWVWHFIAQKHYRNMALNFANIALCFFAAIATFALLYRRDSLAALPAMIGYWGGQQAAPRLPGPHDYYARLLLIYELPLLSASVWGAWCALKKRSTFTDLLLWWAFTSVVLYAVANEKVPWLMTHQVLPLALLGGFGIAQIEWKTTIQKAVFATAVMLGAVFSSRHIMATNWEHAANHHEPLFFAQTMETYRDTLFELLDKTNDLKARDVWAAPEEQWPVAWYLRENAPALEGSEMRWDAAAPQPSTLRLVIAPEEQWKNMLASGKFTGWKYLVVERYIWPRPSWKAMEPGTFWEFWRTRKASEENGILEEEFTANSIFATPPDAKIDKNFSSNP